MSTEDDRLEANGFDREELPIGVRYVKRCHSNASGASVIVTIYKYTDRWIDITGMPLDEPWTAAVSVGVEICCEHGKTLDDALDKVAVKAMGWLQSIEERITSGLILK